MKEKVYEWLEKAEKDLKAAKILLNEIPEYSAYHSQQAVEKYLKAFLVKNNVDFPKTHNIYFLLELCVKVDNGFEKLKEENVARITRYAYIRYPGKLSVSKKEAEEAIEIAERVKKFVLEKIYGVSV